VTAFIKYLFHIRYYYYSMDMDGEDVIVVKSKFTDLTADYTEDELRLANLGYSQEMKRVFNVFTTFGLAASMISVLLGIIPLYSYSLQTGGPANMFWSWLIVGIATLIVVSSLGEICCAFPTMGALYYWAFRLGGPDWGPFASWMAGWCNLLGQIAGVASGGYSGAQIIANIVSISTNYNLSNAEILGVYAVVLIAAGVVNSFTELLLTKLCFISVAWHIIGTLIIVIWMLCTAPKLQDASFVFFQFENGTDFSSSSYVAVIGILFAASTFTGYDTAAHVAEETTSAHHASPWAMLLSVVNCLILGTVLIIGMNFCIQDINELIGNTTDDTYAGQEAYTILWQQTVGKSATIFFLIIVFVAVECSNCANLTSACRMVYSFARDGAIPSFLYHLDDRFHCPLRSIWFCVLAAFILGIPGLDNTTVLGALFSLTATGLYSSYLIPILLRITISRDTFETKEFSLGQYSIPFGIFSVGWCLIMIAVLCMPEANPMDDIQTLNYSGIALGGIIFFAYGYWVVSARHWFKGANTKTLGSALVRTQDGANMSSKNLISNNESSEKLREFEGNDDMMRNSTKRAGEVAEEAGIELDQVHDNQNKRSTISSEITHGSHTKLIDNIDC